MRRGCGEPRRAAAPRHSFGASILIWADPIAVGIAVAAVVVVATIVGGTGGCGTDRRGAVGCSTPSPAIGGTVCPSTHRRARDRTAGYRPVSVAASGDTDTSGVNGDASDVCDAGTTAVEPASTVAAATAS